LALSTDAGDRSVIAKTARARERAALEVLTSANVPLVPRLLAACDDPALVLMEDAGSGLPVAHRLLGDDPDEAAAAVRRWTGVLARMQAASPGLGAAFHRRLAELTAILKPDEGGVLGRLAARALAATCAARGEQPLLLSPAWRRAHAGPA
jgi:hypothetical protein